MPALTEKELALEQVRVLYAGRLRGDSPPAEIEPRGAIERAMRRGEYVCFGAMAGEDILAYAFFIRLEKGEKEFALFDCLAVKKRSALHGRGQRVSAGADFGSLEKNGLCAARSGRSRLRAG